MGKPVRALHKTGIYSDKTKKCMPDQPYSVLSTYISINVH